MNTSKTKRIALIGASMLTAVLDTDKWPDFESAAWIEMQRALFEADAEPYGFDLTRQDHNFVEPWADYDDDSTGHRWGGWLARAASV